MSIKEDIKKLAEDIAMKKIIQHKRFIDNSADKIKEVFLNIFKTDHYDSYLQYDDENLLTIYAYSNNYIVWILYNANDDSYNCRCISYKNIDSIQLKHQLTRHLDTYGKYSFLGLENSQLQGMITLKIYGRWIVYPKKFLDIENVDIEEICRKEISLCGKNDKNLNIFLCRIISQFN